MMLECCHVCTLSASHEEEYFRENTNWFYNNFDDDITDRFTLTQEKNNDLWHSLKSNRQFLGL